MFSRLDTNFDLQLDHSEIKSLYLDRNEPCSDRFFRSCNVHADKVISSTEWCTCFQRYTGNQRLPFEMSRKFHMEVTEFCKLETTFVLCVHEQNT